MITTTELAIGIPLQENLLLLTTCSRPSFYGYPKCRYAYGQDGKFGKVSWDHFMPPL
jgi:hypothetical protein